MQTVSCPTCGNPLPDADGSCAHCDAAAEASENTPPLAEGGALHETETPGEEPALPTSQQESEAQLESDDSGHTLKLTHKDKTTRPSSETPQELSESAPTIRLSRKAVKPESKTVLAEAETTLNLKQLQQQERNDATLNLKQLRRGARTYLEADMLAPGDETQEAEDQDDEIVERHETWQKVVEYKTPPSLPVIALASSHTRRRRFYSSLRPAWCSPRAFFWLNALLLCALLLAGGFGVAIGFARNTPRAVVPPALALQGFPGTIALGGILTLRGTHFTPSGQVALSRDKHITVLDTGGASTVRADAYGTFSDTIVADPAWLSGSHILYATDTHTHRQAHFTILVTGQNALQGPPHLLLSATTLNLGTGDEATNSNKLLALSNAGGGQVIWQASADQPWLQISPSSGSIASGSHQAAVIAIDRSGLAPGSYHTTLLFASNTEQVSLPVTMQVVPLQANHEAVLQASPAALAFTGSAQGPEPQAQTITVSNPGTQTLTWSSSISLPNGFGWFWMTPQAGTIAPGGQQQITMGVTTQNLRQGVYRGTILFTNQGPKPIQGSPQSIYMSLTITPACTLALAPGNLSFTGVHGQAAPSGQTLHLDVAQGCRTSQIWTTSVHTTNGGNWLHVNQSRASTPSSIQVSADTTGLGPGTYSGSLTFTVNTGPQIVPVTLNVNPLPCTISGQSTLAFQGVAGQTGPAGQTVTLSTGGDCLHTLNWTSAVSGGTWLSAAPSGTLTQPGTASVNVQTSLVGLGVGTYTGTVSITAVDSATNATVSSVQTSVTLTVLPPCTLQAASASTLTFTATVGNNPTTQSFTISAIGTCAGNVTITPSVDSGSSAWQAVSGPVTIASGGTATFTVTITSSTLAVSPPSYSGTITLAAADGNGPITGSPQTVSVTLTIQ